MKAENYISLLHVNEKSFQYSFSKATKIPTNCLYSLKFISAFIIAFIVHYDHFPVNHGLPFENIFKWSYTSGAKIVELFYKYASNFI